MNNHQDENEIQEAHPITKIQESVYQKSIFEVPKCQKNIRRLNSSDLSKTVISRPVTLATIHSLSPSRVLKCDTSHQLAAARRPDTHPNAKEEEYPIYYNSFLESRKEIYRAAI